MKDPAISFRGVCKYYPLYQGMKGGIKNFLFHLPRHLKSMNGNRFLALKDISFDIPKGECCGLIGMNGAGKSTMLALMAGVIKPTEGRLEVRGRVAPMLELGAGFHPDLTGRENIVLNGVLMGLTRKEVNSKADQIIDFSGVGGFIDQPVRIYSTGMMARLGFSVLCHLSPDILLIDEVLAVGDADFQKKCIDKIEQFKKHKVTIVLASHSLENIRTMCDRVLWIEDHVLKMAGAPDEVIKEYSAV